MPREFSRARRMAAQIQRELATLLSREVNDPRLHAVTVSYVEVTPDLACAKVFLTTPHETDPAQFMKPVARAGGFLRRELSRRIRARSVPRLEFVHDVAFERANRLVSLIDSTITAPQVPSDDRNREQNGDK
jgi:ribosome-binding factor A